MLEAITDAYASEWTALDDSDGYASDFFDSLGLAWAEALLSVELTAEERQEWTAKLTRWQVEISRYGVDNVFDAAQAAAVQSWDDPYLQRALQGEVTEYGAWEGEPPSYADQLTTARLKLLERRGQHQEYLNLALAEGQTGHYVLGLVRLGRFQEARR